jgi:O-acetyl-ADP-ribose deacetylase (regulator of RNase III)
MTELQIGPVRIELVTGDIARQQGFDAVVNAANAALRTGGGVAGALHRRAGPGLEREARVYAPIRPGEAVVTGGHDLPNPWVIHCLGPVYGQDEPSAALLAACYREALRLAEEKSLRSIAIPSISTGAFGYPMDEAARVAFRTLLAEAPRLASVERIRFVLFDDEALKTHARALEAVAREVDAA